MAHECGLLLNASVWHTVGVASGLRNDAASENRPYCNVGQLWVSCVQLDALTLLLAHFSSQITGASSTPLLFSTYMQTSHHVCSCLCILPACSCYVWACSGWASALSCNRRKFAIPGPVLRTHLQARVMSPVECARTMDSQDWGGCQSPSPVAFQFPLYVAKAASDLVRRRLQYLRKSRTQSVPRRTHGIFLI